MFDINIPHHSDVSFHFHRSRPFKMTIINNLMAVINNIAAGQGVTVTTDNSGIFTTVTGVTVAITFVSLGKLWQDPSSDRIKEFLSKDDLQNIALVSKDFYKVHGKKIVASLHHGVPRPYKANLKLNLDEKAEELAIRLDPNFDSMEDSLPSVGKRFRAMVMLALKSPMLFPQALIRKKTQNKNVSCTSYGVYPSSRPE